MRLSAVPGWDSSGTGGQRAKRSPRPPSGSGDGAGLAAEAGMLAKDPAYVREAREVAGLMEQLRGSW